MPDNASGSSSTAALSVPASTFGVGTHTVLVSYVGEPGYEWYGYDPSEASATVVVTAPTSPPPVSPPPPSPPAAVGNHERLFAIGTDEGVSGEALLYGGDGTLRLLVNPYPDEFTGGVRTAVGDIDGDGTADLITAPGPGYVSHVRVFSGATGGELGSFLAFEESFRGGVYVAAADFDYDGMSEIVVSPDESGAPRVRVLRRADGSGVVADFFGIDDPNFRGGVRVATGDINGDLVPDLVVAAGYGGGPRVAVFSGASALASPAAPGRLVGDFFAFEPELRNVSYVAAGDLSGDGHADLVFGGGPGGGPRILALDGWDLVRSAGSERTELMNTFAFDPGERGGVRVSASDFDGDGWGDVIAAPGLGGGASAVAFAGPDLQQPFGIGGAVDGAEGLFVGTEPTRPGSLDRFGQPAGALTQEVLEAVRDNLLSSIYDLEYLALYQGDAFAEDAYLDDLYRQLDETESEIDHFQAPPPDEGVPLGIGDVTFGGVPLWPDYSTPDRIASDGVLIQATDAAANLDAALQQVLDTYNRAGADAFEKAGNWVGRVSGRREPAIVGLGAAMAIRTGTTNILRMNLPAEQVNRLWPQENNLPLKLRPNANAARSTSNPLYRTWTGTKGGGYSYVLTVSANGASLSVSGQVSSLLVTGSGRTFQFSVSSDGTRFSGLIRGGGFKEHNPSTGRTETVTRDIEVSGELRADGQLDAGVDHLPVLMR